MQRDKIKIAIYANELAVLENTGVKVYTREIIKSLSELDKKNQYVVYLNDLTGSGEEEIAYLKDKPNFTVRISKSRMPFWTYAEFPREIERDLPDVLFMPIQAVPFFNKPKYLKVVSTIHDVAYLYFPDHFTYSKRKLLHFHTKRAAAMSDRIIVPSNATKIDIIRNYVIPEARVEVIYHGAGEFIENAGDETKKKIQNLRPYLLHVGSIQPRKNIISLIRAFENLKANGNELLKLVICGGCGWMCGDTIESAKKSKFSKDIIFTGDVKGEILCELYRNATVFVMPSLYEGFGLPVIEAMKQGTPCAVSGNSSLEEISNNAAVLFNPKDALDIEEKLRALLCDGKLRAELSKEGIERAKQFLWEKSARKHLETFIEA